MSIDRKGRGLRGCFSCTGADKENVVSGGRLSGRGLGFHRASSLFGNQLGLSNDIGIVHRIMGGGPIAKNFCVGPLIKLCHFPHNRSLSCCGSRFRMCSRSHGLGMRG